MDDLVQRLSNGEHSIAIGGSEPFEMVQKRIEEIGYVLVTFTDTRGGTELGVRIERNATDLSQANFDQRTGSAHLEGTLTLNTVNVRCVANIDLSTLRGQGHLLILDAAHP